MYYVEIETKYGIIKKNIDNIKDLESLLRGVEYNGIKIQQDIKKRKDFLLHKREELVQAWAIQKDQYQIDELEKVDNELKVLEKRGNL